MTNPSPSAPLDPCPCCKAAAEETHGAKGTEFEGLVKICCAAMNTDNIDEYPNGCPLDCETAWCKTIEGAEALWRERDTYASPVPQVSPPGASAAGLDAVKAFIIQGHSVDVCIPPGECPLCKALAALSAPSQAPAAHTASIFDGLRAHLFAAREKININSPAWDQLVDACRSLAWIEFAMAHPVPEAPAAPVDARKAHAYGYTCGIADALVLALGEGDPIAAEEGRWKEFAHPGAVSTGDGKDDSPMGLRPYGWAPGEYMGKTCGHCGKVFGPADKLAATCQPCAQAMWEKDRLRAAGRDVGEEGSGHVYEVWGGDGAEMYASHGLYAERKAAVVAGLKARDENKDPEYKIEVFERLVIGAASGSPPRAVSGPIREAVAGSIIAILERFYGDDDYSNADACQDLMALLGEAPAKASGQTFAQKEYEKIQAFVKANGLHKGHPGYVTYGEALIVFAQHALSGAKPAEVPEAEQSPNDLAAWFGVVERCLDTFDSTRAHHARSCLANIKSRATPGATVQPQAPDILAAAREVAKTFTEWEQSDIQIPDMEMLDALHSLVEAVESAPPPHKGGV